MSQHPVGCLHSEDALGQHRIGHLEEAGDVGTGLQMGAILLCCLHITPSRNLRIWLLHLIIAANDCACDREN